MTARATWKGALEIGPATLPVKLFSAVQEERVHFRVLAGTSRAPAEQHWVDPSTDEIVPFENVRRGFPVEGGFVVLTKDELAALQPEASRTISVSRFLPERKLGPEWFVRPYYLAPDGPSEPYFALAKALEETGTEGIAHWVMRGHAYTGALRSVGGYLMLLTLRHAEEVVTRAELPSFQGRAYGAMEKKMAAELVTAYEGELDLAELADTYRERVEAFAKAKLGGRAPRLEKPHTKEESKELADALSRSLAAVKKERAKAAETPRASRARTRRGHAEKKVA